MDSNREEVVSLPYPDRMASKVSILLEDLRIGILTTLKGFRVVG